MKMLVTALATAVLLAAPACSKKKDDGAKDKPTDKPTAATTTPDADKPPDRPPKATAPRVAAAELRPTKGSETVGTVLFTELNGKVTVTAEITGLTPGEHGFHLHEKGDCSAEDGTSAGGHWNPGNAEHGAPAAEKHHAGDLGNITADASGTANHRMTIDFISIASGADNDAVGRGVIVHAKPDDLKSQPTGAAGARLACGVVEEKRASAGP